MLSKTLDKIGDYNPQLFRELKGNLNARNLILTVLITLIVQIFLTTTFSENRCVNYDSVVNVCRHSKLFIQWNYLFRTLNYLIPLTAYIGGVYQLLSDLSKEQNRGTLNFIRLTPQPSQKILLGKILGVPSLVYIGVLTSIPLHFISGIFSEISLFWLLGIYSLWIAGGLFFSVVSTFYTLLLGVQTNSNALNTSINGLGCFVALMVGIPYVQIVDFSHDLYSIFDAGFMQWSWFRLPLGNFPFLGYCWLMGTVLTLTYWLWKAVNRRFNNPNHTPLSKIQAYGVTTCFQLWLLGFLIPSAKGISNDLFQLGLFFIFLLIPIVYLVIIVAVTPQRQTLLDWARYRHQLDNRQDLWQDFLIGEKSPALLTIALNTVVTLVLWGSWLLLVPKDENFYLSDLSPWQIIFGLILTIIMGLVYTLIIQMCLLMKTNKRWELGTVIMALVIISPVILGWILAVKSISIPLIWAFSPFPIVLLISGGEIFSIIAGLFAQIGLLSWLTLKFKKQLEKAGASETKTILIGH